MKTEKIVLNSERKVFLTTYIQETDDIETRAALLILPGGGYHICAPREGESVALAFMKYGFNAFVLNYSVDNRETMPGNQAWPNPLEDYEQAMEYLISNTTSLKVDPARIALVGFSAGGHLASAAVVSADHRPAACILGYPVTGFDERYGEGMYDATANVDERTCPCFIFAAADDPVVDVMNSIKFVEALAEKGVPFESHFYSHGPHAFSVCDPTFNLADHCPRISDWVDDSAHWLDEILG